MCKSDEFVLRGGLRVGCNLYTFTSEISGINGPMGIFRSRTSDKLIIDNLLQDHNVMGSEHL